jgi:hypothetical protein
MKACQAHTLPSARTFVREASSASQRRILNRVKAKNLIELWERMKTPDFDLLPENSRIF